MIINSGLALFSEAARSQRAVFCSVPMAGMADEGAFVFDTRMSGNEAEPTHERPTDCAVERRLVAESTSSVEVL